MIFDKINECLIKLTFLFQLSVTISNSHANALFSKKWNKLRVEY